MSGEGAYWYQSTRTREISKVVLIIGELSWWAALWSYGESHRAAPARNDEISTNQFGFMPGRSTTEAIFLIRHVMERFREQKKDLHLVFIDLEKAYDKIPRNVMWWSLDKHKISSKYMILIKDMYNNVVTSVRTNDGNTDYFSIKIRLHQGSALSP